MAQIDMFDENGLIVANTLVDDDDLTWLSDFSIWRKKDEYGDRAYVNCPNGKKIALSRLILEHHGFDIDDKLVDHQNGLTLDNRKSNLRITDATGNSRNKRKSKRAVLYKNVRFVRGRYTAYITVNYRSIFIGTFLNPRDAAIAYDIKAIEYFGEYAKLNVPEASSADKARVINALINPKKHAGTSCYRGVGRSGAKWKAVITIDYKPKHLGSFATEVEAAAAYNKAAIHYHGSKAKLNILS